MSVTADISATAVTSSSAITRGSVALALSPCFAGRFVSTISSFMPSARPWAFPPSRYTTPSATYFTLKTVRRFGSSTRPISVDVSVGAEDSVVDGEGDDTGTAGSLLDLSGSAGTSAGAGAGVNVEVGAVPVALTPAFALLEIWTGAEESCFAATSGAGEGWAGAAAFTCGISAGGS